MWQTLPVSVYRRAQVPSSAEGPTRGRGLRQQSKA